jgi:peptide/nickel transport system permease protein
MWTYIVKRVLQAIPTLLVISFLIFSLLYITPGDPVLIMLGTGENQTMTEEAYEAAKHDMGLDRPMMVRYTEFITGAMRGDLGVSYITDEDVFDTIVDKMPATLILTLASILLALQPE